MLGYTAVATPIQNITALRKGIDRKKRGYFQGYSSNHVKINHLSRKSDSQKHS